MRKTEYYINDNELYYEIRLSQGKGYLTARATAFFILIADNFIRRKRYMNDDLRNDCYQTAIEHMLKNYMNFNYKKYNKALPYMTEICKRGLAMGFNESIGSVPFVIFDEL